MWALALALFCAVAPARACSVPVFRYALEHWAPDPYQALVFHRGALSEAEQALVRELGAEGLAGTVHANLSLRTVDLEQEVEPNLLALWRSLKLETLPALVVNYPVMVRARPLYAGPLSEAAIHALLESPLRQEIVERLMDGESAVWVLVEIGDRARDTAAAELLQERLGYLNTTLQLPALSQEDIARGLVSVPAEQLRVEFSLLRLARNHPEEQILIQMLLGTEPDLKELEDPMVFPIFGQGRALYALVGAGIKRENIDQAASFLIGRCSCEVKEQNPGVDLLIAAHWDAEVKARSGPLPELPMLGDLAMPETVTISGDEAAGPDIIGGPASRTGNVAVIGSIGMVALLGAGLLLWRRR